MTAFHQIHPQDASFPTRLSGIQSVPDPLYVRGNLGALQAAHPIAVVGTRKMTLYGEQVLAELIPELVRAGATIVSGLAYGIDALAHRIALQHGGTCIAVLGCGIDQITPTLHQPLAQDILDTGGAIVSEYPPGTQAQKFTFIARNRLISGLSTSTLVIEAGQGSGALYTADFAFKQGRAVYTVPGSIYARQLAGNNALFHKGAKAITSPAKLLADLGLAKNPQRRRQRRVRLSSSSERQLYELFREARSVDDIQAELSMPLSELNTILATMELKGLLIRKGPQVYVRN